MTQFMKKSYSGFSLYMLFPVLLLLLVGILVGSFFDLQIANGIYVGDNFWSIIVEYVGPLPSTVIIVSAGVFLYHHFINKDTPHHKIFAWFYLILVIAITGSFWGYDTLHRHLDGAYWWFIIGIPVIAVTEIPVFFLLKNGNKDDYLRKGLIIIVASLLVLILTFGVKLLVIRPRYMFMLKWDRLDLYKPWYTFGGDKSIYQNLPGYESYAIQSWPSGHSSFASMMILLVLFPSCFEKTKGKEIFFFIGGMVYAFLVMLARMLDGHHFLSDVSFGAFFGFISCVISLVGGSCIKKKKTEEVKN